MSSPMHSLRKNKVPLFPGHMSGHRPIPFRHPEYSEDESKLLDEITTAMVTERRRNDPPLPLTLPSLNPAQTSNSHAAGGKVPSMLKRFGAGAAAKPDAGICTESGGEEGREDSVSPREPPSDKELMRLMMNRIAVLEQANQTQEENLRAKDKRIKVLEDRLRIAEKARREAASGSSMKELETHCLLLQQQVHEMETFLAEYGMVWVGENHNDSSDVYIDDGIYDDSDDDQSNNDNPSLRSSSPSTDNLTVTSNPFGVWRQDTSLASGERTNTSGLNIDFNLLIENINDLNVLAGAGVAQIKKTSDGARFEMPEPVQLTIYANGILMFDGPFRPYTEPSTRQCVQDFLDGYFPSELQHRYPDGVPFVVTDLRGTFYQMRAGPLAFTGEGQTLGGETGPSRLIPTRVVDQSKKIPLPTVGGAAVSSQTASPGASLNTAPSHLRKPLTQSQFLNKLPKSVIRDGKIIDVRDSVGKALSGNDGETSVSNVTLINTNVTKEMSESVTAPNSSGPGGVASNPVSSSPRPKSSFRDVTTLRVVAEQGAHTYIVKMKFSETIGNLRTYLDTQRRPTAPYDIVSTFPHKIHKNNSLTLEESGLTPNAVLHLKPHK
ncbi:ubx domain-containing protein 11-like [Plakobranchus ocellatus]|uniref:UBX domain-containing protein 11 n=1 Tax=Plakobranchus ocellatus TaxID=259542 RepID=A0AAV3YVD5_9GAST|nr:ubx domain-containing protein 11-like [Plakobranchus ocellatus]